MLAASEPANWTSAIHLVPKPDGDWTVKSVKNAKIGGNTVGDILGAGFNHKDYKAAYDYANQFQGDPPKKKSDKGEKRSKGVGSDTEKNMMKASDDANEKMAFDSVPNIRIHQIVNAEQDVIRHDHIDKTHKALEKAGSNKADKFKELGFSNFKMGKITTILIYGRF